MLNNYMARAVKEVEVTCGECRGLGYIYPYDEETGKSKRTLCTNCDGLGFITKEK